MKQQRPIVEIYNRISEINQHWLWLGNGATNLERSMLFTELVSLYWILGYSREEGANQANIDLSLKENEGEG